MRSSSLSGCPNHFRSLFAEGAFNAAFVPMFSGLLVKEGQNSARAFAERVYTILLLSQIVLLIAFVIAMPWFMYVFAPGFADQPYKFDLAVLFTRITFPYLLFITLVSLLGGVLNSINRFWAAASAPILLNLCLIAALWWLTPILPTAGHALAWGVFAAGIAQYLLLAWDSWRAGYWLRLTKLEMTPAVKKFLQLLGTASIGAGIVQMSLFFDTLIASFLPTGAVSYLYYADRINQLPLGVIGIAVGTVLLPELSRHLSRDDGHAALWSQNRAIELSLLLTLPAAAAFMTIANPIIAALFQRGAFGPADTQACAITLMAYALGLPAFVMQRSSDPRILRAGRYRNAGQSRSGNGRRQCRLEASSRLLLFLCPSGSRRRHLPSGLGQLRVALWDSTPPRAFFPRSAIGPQWPSHHPGDRDHGSGAHCRTIYGERILRSKPYDGPAMVPGAAGRSRTRRLCRTGIVFRARQAQRRRNLTLRRCRAHR